MTLYLFTYGSLKNNDLRYNLLGYDTKAYDGVLNDYEVKDHRATPYPTLNPKKDSMVYGVYFEIDLQDLLILDKYENNLYVRIRIILDDGTECITYIEKTEYYISEQLYNQ